MENPFDALATILQLPSSDDNKLQPSYEQVGELMLNIKFLEFINGCDMYGVYSLLKLNYAGLYDKREPCFIQDQQQRVDEFVDHMIMLGSKKIVMMDGHGRTVLQFLNSLFVKNEDLNTYHITLVDVDTMTDRWHKLMYPKKYFTCLNEDVFKASMTTDASIYLNFCGATPYMNEIKKIITKSMTWKNRGLMLSMATRKASRLINGVNYYLRRKLYGRIVKSPNKKMRTFIF